MLKTKNIIVQIDGTIQCQCHLIVLFEPNRLPKRYLFNGLQIKYKYVAANWEELVNFASVFDAFNRNFLNNGVKYRAGEIEFKLDTNSIKHPKLNLKMYRDSQEALSYSFNKHETLIIATKLAKIVNKTDFEQSYE